MLKETLREIVISQKSELSLFEYGIDREELKKIDMQSSFAMVLSGIRRCGKSTLLNQVLQKQERGYYLNLEDPRLEGFALSDFAKVESVMGELYGEGGTYFFDEIQHVEQWERFIRHLIDRKIRVVITGSNASLLSRELGTKLTGRHLQVELFPFSFGEFLAMQRQRL